MTDQATPTTVNWRRVAIFYGVALGGAILVALVIWLMRATLGEAAALAGLAAAALLYMPLPLVAGLVVERVAGRRPLIADEWHALRTHFWRTYGRNALVAVALILAVLGAGITVAWLAGVAGVPGAGHLVGSDSELHERMLQVVPGLTADAGLPSLASLALVGIAEGILAGLTINAVFAFGEEYGWRGVLADELRPLGLVRATALTGVLWGLWHAPIIVLGHNYGPEWGWGIFAMVAWTVPLSFLLTWARERTGSVLAPAILHGAYNGVIGLFAYLVIGGHVLIAVPMGVLMALALAVLAAIVWRLPTRAADRQPAQRVGTV
ncbi:MAG: CPBP family intramembrane glutamic endopeptidase [Propionicimonas sp.]